MLALLTTIMAAGQVAPFPPTITPGNLPQPITDLATLFTDADYPAEARRLGQTGRVAAMLETDSAGRVVGCKVIQSSSSPSLDSATCAILQSRARFKPAVDAGGRATAGVYLSRINWRLAPVATTVPDRFVARMIIGPDGKPRDCSSEATRLGKVTTRSSATCAAMPVPPSMAAGVRAQSTAADIRVRMETRIIRDPGAAWPVLDQKGDKVLAKAAARFQVAPGGKVSECVLLDSTSVGPGKVNPCRTLAAVDDDGRKESAEMRLVTIFALEGEAK